jgi:peptide-methionine (S)-S-oxide reductase
MTEGSPEIGADGSTETVVEGSPVDVVAGSSEIVTLGGGCYWCLEAVFELLEGVESVVSGASGGPEPDPTYEQLCSGRSGHAEVVQLRVDPSVTSFRDILEVFFAVHDPTTLDRQGGDLGPQYRSAIFYHTPEQRETAESVIAELTAEGIWDDGVVTEVTPFDAFYPAKEDHQSYYRRNGAQPYCQIVINPKVAKLRKKFAHKLKNA